MKPLFFPFTYVTEPTIHAYGSFFSGISVFQFSMKHIPEPMRQWAAQGLLEVRGPDPEASQNFDAILSETENWVRYHRGGVASFLKGSQNKVPFFEPSSVSQILRDIREAGQVVLPDMPQEGALLRARIFLQMAQEFDAHNQWLSNQMRQQEVMERNLYRELRGDGHSTEWAIDSDLVWDNDDPFQYMLLDRLKAWSRVMLSHGHLHGPFVTTHPSVLTLIKEHLPDSENLIMATTVPAIDRDAATARKKRQDLIGYCENLVHTPMSRLNDSELLDAYFVETTETLSMKLYLLPGVAPHNFFAKFVDGKLPGGGGDGDVSAAANTLIGYIDKT